MAEVTQKIIKEVYKKRPSEVHKYDHGLLLVIGGSKFYSGSPALSALAAFRAGVDMIQIIAPKRAADIVASFSPNLAAYPLEGDYLKKEHLATLISMTKSAEIVSHKKIAVVIGGGVGRSEETKEVICEYLSQISVPAVIDADAIHAIAETVDILSGKPFLITPHSYEFFLLTQRRIENLSVEERIKVVLQEAERLKTTILLKGGADVISNGKETVVNKTGSPYMSVGGTGDTLAGICGAIMAQGFSSFVAAQAGAFINGKAGEIAAKEKKESILATDLIEAISKVIH